ncbi:hypothetical protein HHK36_028667 [Tetracentron sinense]|uniref:pectinesterase n=1 Tax=Tetracentron sinense TaxID=13715 RepID=A0A834YFG1_TETSI|nr:hypothetical protein HHK36_028667 [Tetracentron sinense]
MVSPNSIFIFFFFFLTLILLHAPLILASSSHYYSLNSTSNACNTTKHHHKWVAPTGYRLITVDAGGSGDFLTVQSAVQSVPENNRENFVIKINAGNYKEKVMVPVTKPYITFQGAGKEVTVIEWHDRASDRGPKGQQLRTYKTASVTVFANYFSAKDISFKVRTSSLSFPLLPPQLRGNYLNAIRFYVPKCKCGRCIMSSSSRTVEGYVNGPYGLLLFYRQ